MKRSPAQIAAHAITWFRTHRLSQAIGVGPGLYRALNQARTAGLELDNVEELTRRADAISAEARVLNKMVYDAYWEARNK